MTAAAFNPALVTIERKRFSQTQGEVLVSYDGQRIEQYGDAIRLVGAEWQGMTDAEWIAVARREAIARGLASEPTRDVLKVTTDRRTSAKRYFLNGKRVSRRDAAKLVNSASVETVFA